MYDEISSDSHFCLKKVSVTPRVSWWVIKAGFQPLYPGILVFHSITTQLNLLEEWFSHKYHLLFVCNKHPPLHMSHFLPPMNKQSWQCMIWLLSVLHTLSRNTHKHITHWVIVLLSTMSGFLVTAKIVDTNLLRVWIKAERLRARGCRPIRELSRSVGIRYYERFDWKQSTFLKLIRARSIIFVEVFRPGASVISKEYFFYYRRITGGFRKNDYVL